jgi:hypothetical protein
LEQPKRIRAKEIASVGFVRRFIGIFLSELKLNKSKAKVNRKDLHNYDFCKSILPVSITSGLDNHGGTGGGGC